MEHVPRPEHGDWKVLLLQAGHDKAGGFRGGARGSGSVRRNDGNQQLEAHLFGVQQINGPAEHGGIREALRILYRLKVNEIKEKQSKEKR